ncbi:MAG: macro domain-containing protein [Bacteroidota bacterium]
MKNMIKIKPTIFLLALVSFSMGVKSQATTPQNHFTKSVKQSISPLPKRHKASKINKKTILCIIAACLTLTWISRQMIDETQHASTKANQDKTTKPKTTQTPIKPKKPKPVNKEKAKKLTTLIQANSQYKVRKDTIIPTNSILTDVQLADKIQVTELDCSDAEIFEKLGHKPEDVLLVNAANPNIYFGMGGINGALSKLVTDCTGLGKWGTITDLDNNKINFPKHGVEVGSVCITTAEAPGKPTIQIVHIVGPNQENGKQLQKKVRQAYKSVVDYAIKHEKHLVCCTISTALYCKDEAMFNDMCKACWLGIGDSYSGASSHSNSIKTRIYLNLWHRDIIRNIPNKKLFHLVN